MDIEGYYSALAEIATELASPNHDSLEQSYLKGSGAVWEAVEWRRKQLTRSDIDRVAGLLETGYLSAHENEARMAFFIFALELGPEFRRFEIQRLCEQYNRHQPIFRTKPALWDEIRRRESGVEDLELLSLRRFKQYEDTNLFEFDGMNFVLTGSLKPSIISWSMEHSQSAPMYARFNPYVCKTDKVRLVEFAMLVPPNPDWWANTSILRGQVDGCTFILQDCPCSIENEQQYKEYHMLNIRMLDISCRRSNGLNLSMSLEELSVDGDALVGRMIHLDSDCPPGTPAAACTLNHLDLAINYYLDDSSNTRMTQKLSDAGKVVDATHRIHLFRIENIPLSSVLSYVDMFFESTILKTEWRNSQLGG